jgi:hypothetical protein
MDFSRKAFNIDFFAIDNGEVHIFGRLWRDYEDIHETTFSSAIIPIAEFVEKYGKDGEDYIDDFLCGVHQCEADSLTEEDAEEIFNNFYNGVAPEGELEYSEITLDTEDGNYYNTTIY